MKLIKRSVEFFCPKCGVYTCFGSDSDLNTGRVIGYHCTGDDEGGCHGNFRCDASEFWKYQRLVEEHSFESEAELRDVRDLGQVY